MPAMRLLRTRSLKSVLLTHELAFLLLVVVTGAMGGMWAFFWQQTSAESVRINHMTYAAQQIRSDLFRQVKEATLARIMEDEDALRVYAEYSGRIDKNFNMLRQEANSREEDQAVHNMQQAYRVIQFDMNNIFSDPYAINRAVRIQILKPNYEEQMIADFDQALKSLEILLAAQQQELERTMEGWTRLAPWLVPIPILLAVALLLFSRRSLQRGFVRPVGEVIEGAQLISRGQLEHQIPARGVEEMATLAEAINRMAADLARSRDALVESERQATLGALVPVVAHNIRNPLATIRASAQLVDDVEQPSDLQEIKEAIINTVDRLGRWVNALVSYLHPLKPQPQERPLAVVVDAGLELLAPRIADKNVKVERRGWEQDSRVWVDADLMEQALYGLLSNALDASPEGSKLEVALRRDDTQVWLTIEDQGAGIPFDPEPTALAPGPSTKRFGTGLGIPIAFKVCSAHGWKLYFERRPSGGTRVTVRASAENKREEVA